MTASGLAQMRQLLEAAGLCAPPVPGRLAADLTERGTWCYATRDLNLGSMYLPSPYAVEVVTGPVEDYVALSHCGHGVNSYEIAYHLVYGQLALFTGTGWGGVYMDKEKSSAAVREAFGRCSELVALYEAVRKKLPPLPSRLVVVEEEFSGLRVCEWLDRPLASEGAALTWLRSRKRPREGAVGSAIGMLSQLRVPGTAKRGRK